MAIPEKILLRLGSAFSSSAPLLTSSEKAFIVGLGAKSAKFSVSGLLATHSPPRCHSPKNIKTPKILRTSDLAFLRKEFLKVLPDEGFSKLDSIVLETEFIK
jgi:hypothetical protein